MSTRLAELSVPLRFYLLRGLSATGQKGKSGSPAFSF